MRMLPILILLFFLSGCEAPSLFDESQLLGNWQAVSWVDETNDKVIDVPVNFQFDTDGRYIGSYGNKAEEGRFWISDDNLHTIEDGKAEKKVKIEVLTSDSLVFGMNRAGNIEKITLLKVE